MEEVSRGARPSFDELLVTELRLDPRQWVEAPRREEAQASSTAAAQRSDAVLDVDCLVHQDWVRGVSCGSLPLPHAPPLPAEEIHWLLQTSCDSPTPKHWQRVSILCIRKALESDTTRAAKRFLISQEKGYSKESIHELLTQISQENLLMSWQELLQPMHPAPSTGPRHPTSAYVREVIHKLYHIEVCSLQPVKAGGQKKKVTGRETNTSHHSPTWKPGKERKKQAKITSSSSTKEQVHSNLSPLLAVVESHRAFYLVFPYLQFTLFDIAVHSPAMFNDSVSKPLFVLFQLLKVLEHCHKVGVTLGPLTMCSVFVDSRLWVQLRVPAAVLRLEHGSSKVKGGTHMDGKGVRGRVGENLPCGVDSKRGKDRGKQEERRSTQEDSRSASASTLAGSEVESEGEWTESAKDTSTESSPAKQLQQTSDHRPPHFIPEPPVMPLSEAVKKWQHGELDNFNYIMLLNYHAGRRVGDPNNHPIFPWVSDFTHPSRGFRDLTKSKHRLNKGDDQLNFTYYSAKEEARRILDQESPIAHHVGDISTDVTYYVYMARRTPRDVLCSHVRPRWVPEEYPASIEKMYIWTPDESIPEFFTDPLIFQSIHTDLPDLALPVWCPTPEAFITAHRRILEGDYVSLHLHHWIDLTFGYKLSGEAAVRAKNVYISLVDKHKNPKNHGIVQLFRTSHPKRAHYSTASVALFEWESYLGQSSVSDGANFPINRREMVAPAIQASSNEGNGGRAQLRTLESIVEQQTQKPIGGSGEEETDRNVHVGAIEETPQDENNDSSFEQIAIPDETYGSTPSRQNGTIGISYGESPLDLQLPAQVKSALRPKEGAVLNAQTPAAQQNRFRVVNYFRQRRQNQSEGSSDEYLWQNAEISLPRDCHVLHRLVEQEERAHFVARCCKDFGDTLSPAWEQKDIEEASRAPTPASLPLLEVLQRQHTDPLFTPSLGECVSIDVASAVATVIEMCSMRELRVATRTNASLLERITVIRKLLCSGQLRLPSYLQNLAEFVLLPDMKKTHLRLPRLSPSLLLQPFVPIVSFPSYFELMYSFASKLELLCREAGLKRYHDLQQLATHPLSPLSRHADINPGILDKITAVVVENLQSLARASTSEGFVLLLLHLYPLFQYPETSFEMIQSHLDTLGKFLSHVQMDRLFKGVLLHFFDSPLEPHQQGYLLSRSMADFLIRRFGLHIFLGKFLEFFLEAVLEPARLSTKGAGVRKNIFRLKESESILTLIPSDLGQSLQYDDHKRQSHVSDFTFSVDLSETGVYNSDREYSSGESDNEFVPEASLLAQPGMVLGSLGMSMEEGEGEREKRDDEGQSLQHHRMMLLPQSSIAESTESTLTGLRSRVHGNEATPETGSLHGETELDRELGSSQKTLRIDTTSFKASLDSPTNSSVTTMNLGSPSLEDSFQSCTSNSRTSPFSRNTLPQGSGTTGASTVSCIQANEFFTSETGEEREGGRMEGKGRGLENGNEGKRESGGEGGGVCEGEEEEELVDKMTEDRSNPQLMAINQQIAEIAGDCLCWLQRRLGPLLATRHIINPLLNGMHRCFTGILDCGGRGAVVLKCLSSMAELFGDNILLKMYLPRVEDWVLSATNHMSVKTESNVAASLALVKLITQQLSDQLLEEVTYVLCESFFIPLIQLLSSQTIFPSGGEARATICHSLVLILLKTGERLGREKSLLLLLETLRLFFTCFDGVHPQSSAGESDLTKGTGTRGRTESLSPSCSTLLTQSSAPGKLQERERERSNTASPSTSGIRRTNRSRPKKTVSLEREGQVSSGLQATSHSLNSSSDWAAPALYRSDWSEALEQLQVTFTPAMAHATYIPFCMLLGQIKLNMELRNTELIEQITYSYDKDVQQKSCLPSVFPSSGDELSSTSNSESEDSAVDEQMEDDMARDVTIKLGPVVALQKKSGLDEDAVNFGRPSWFVDLQEGSDSGSNLPTSGVTSGVERGNESLVATGVGGASGAVVGGSTEVTKSTVEDGGGGKGWIEGVRGSAMATASGLLQLIQSRPSTDAQPGGTARTDSLSRHSINFDMKFQMAPAPQSGQSSFNGKSAALLNSSLDDVDCRLSGQWSELWESQLHHSPHTQELYSHFMARKLQTYTGHKGSVRCLAVSDSEHFFVSGSKDRTVKLWLLRNQGSGSAHLSPHLTYSHHQKSVSHVELMSAMSYIVSCDGTVHLWDSESGFLIHQFSSSRSREFIAMKCLLPPQPVAVVATNDLALRFIDFRAQTLQHSWKLHFTTGGILRCLACGDNWVAVGNNSGTVNTLDLRMGELLHHWRPSDYSVVQTTTWNENLFQLRATRHGNLVTSVGPGTLHLWRPSTGKLLSHIRGQLSTTHCLDTMGEQLVSASSNGQVVIHNCFERTKDPSSTLYWGTKVRSRELKGGVASMATLQENRLLLLGSDNGQVVLMS